MLQTQKPSFAQVREDPLIELYAYGLLDENNKLKNALCITSGGCTILSLLTNCNKFSKIDAIDASPQQNYLCELKYAVILSSSLYYFPKNLTNIEKSKKNIEFILDFYNGKFESKKYDMLLEKIHNDEFDLISQDCYNYWKQNKELLYMGINRCGKFEQLFRNLVKSDYNYKETFNRKNLTENFGENAVNHTTSIEFSDYFKQIIDKYKVIYDNNPSKNYFYNQIVLETYPENEYPPYIKKMNELYNNSLHNVPTPKIKYITNNFNNHLSTIEDNYYSFIQTSNLTDWFNETEIKALLSEIYRCICLGGVIVMRRMVADYNLAELILNAGFTIVDCPIDKTFLYSEVIIAIR